MGDDIDCDDETRTPAAQAGSEMRILVEMQKLDAVGFDVGDTIEIIDM